MPKLLVIEDEESVRIPLVDLLEIEGFDVAGAKDGEEGIQMAFEETPDLILCDVMMPGMDGFQVLREIRSRQALTMVPFIFLSARIENKDTERGLNLGADDYVCKPFDPPKLVKRIRSRLEKYRAMSEAINEVRSSLIGKVPHEFKTPLNGILGFASMMKENALLLSPSEVRDFSALILESGERMLQTVISYVRYLELQIDMGENQFPEKYINARCKIDSGKLDALLERLLGLYPQRKGDIEMFVEPARLAVREEDVLYIIHQMLDNALKFSNANTPVNLNTIVDSSFYVISVADRGQGIDESQVSVLDPFVQLDRDSREQQGLGLGLSVIRSLTKLYGGSLSINSQSGEGTRVIARLPISGEDSFRNSS